MSLGKTPLANALLRADQLDASEPTYPLDLAFCPHCALVQITETIPPEQLFREYAYFSSYSDTMLRHARELTQRLITERGLNDQSLVIEIASNDGYLLQNYVAAKVGVLGIEPARNIAEVARVQRHVPTLCEFFGADVACNLAQQGQRADVIHAHNVLAHVADLNGVIAGIHALLKDNGVAVIEVPYVKDLVEHVEFDTIYHEHLCYFSLTAVNHLLRRHALQAIHVEHVVIHGGTLRIFAARDNGTQHPSATVGVLLAEEKQAGLDRLDYYLVLRDKVDALRQSLTTLLTQLKSQRRRIAAYGASAKGSTLLNYFGLGRDVLDYVVDRSDVKQGRYTPGTHLQIYHPSKLVEDRPDYVLLLTWNFAAEILEQQQAYRAAGGQFIIPIPEVKVA